MQKLKNQNGFAIVEVVLVILLLAAVGAAGYFAYQDHHAKTTKTASVATRAAAKPAQAKSSPPSAPTTATYTDPNGYYTLQYPISWSAQNSSSGPSMGISSMPYVGNGANLLPADDTLSQGVGLILYKTGDVNTLYQYYFNDPNGSSTNNPPQNVQHLTINGRQAVYVQDIEADYTDDMYFVTDGSVSLRLLMRESQSSAIGPGQPAFSQASLVPQFTAIAKSVKFLK